MIRHIWSVLSHSASFDQETNSASLLNILETIVVNGEPTIDTPASLPQAALVSLWTREDMSSPATGKMRAYIVTPRGEKIAEPIQLDITLMDHHLFHRSRVNIQGLPLSSLGQYNFHVEYRSGTDTEWQPAAIVPLILIRKTANET